MFQVIFHPCKIRKWHGRYGRIEGKDYVFHVKWHYDKQRWWICISQNSIDGKAICWACEHEQINKIVEAVNKGKRHLVPGHQPGGSFLINEYGQVLVPASNGARERVIVGEVEGKILFENAFTGKLIDLSECDNLKLGDRWNRPYIGIPYNLSIRNRIYFCHDIEEGRNIEYLYRRNRGRVLLKSLDDDFDDYEENDENYIKFLDKRYDELIKKLRKLRPYGPVRFIVNPYGIVLTKILSGEAWLQVFVCKLNYNYWFQKEA